MLLKNFLNQYILSITNLSQINQISWPITVIYFVCILCYFYYTKRDKVNILSNSAISTPKKRFTLFTMFAIFIMLSPYNEGIFYFIELSRNKFPENADSISLPIYWYVHGLLLLSPLIIPLVYLALKNYPGKVFLFEWNKARPYWSLVWSIGFYCFTLYHLYFSIYSLKVLHFEDCLGNIFTCYLLLCFRASLVMSTLFQNKHKLNMVSSF